MSSFTFQQILEQNGPTNEAIVFKCQSKLFTHPRGTDQVKNLTFIEILILLRAEKTDSPMREGSNK